MQLTKRLPYYACLALLVYMPFHIFLAQSLSLITGGLDIWKLAKDAVLALAVLFVICMVWQGNRATKPFRWLCLGVGLYAAIHGIVWAFQPDIYRDSALIGLIYNLRLVGFVLLGYGAVLLWPQTFRPQLLMKLIIVLGTVVALLGIVQYLLPKDILTHAGYGVERGARAAFFIDDKPEFPRIMSTLREPNALGAYLLVPLVATMLYGLQAIGARRRLLLAGMFGMQALALFFTFSRSAWAAAALAVGLAVVWQYRALAWRLMRRLWLPLALVVLLVAAGLYSQRHSPFVQTYITHASNDADLDSNDYHALFLQQGLEGIADQPLGHGPGTAGLASIQNPAGSFLTENYYVQIGYEVGIAGLLLFIAINIMLYVWLWYCRTEPLAVVLLATFWGYMLMNMVLHTWSNEAVACQWWVLAGLVLAALSQHRTQGT